jgi:hypothetical protein
MTRLALALAAWMILVAPVPAALGPGRSRKTYHEAALQVVDVALSARLLGQEPRPEAPPEFTVTNQTEVLLDGKPCRFDAVPRDAAIVEIRLAADEKTAICIRFRTRR